MAKAADSSEPEWDPRDASLLRIAAGTTGSGPNSTFTVYSEVVDATIGTLDRLTPEVGDG